MTNMTREYFARRMFSICDRFDDPNFDIMYYSKKVMAAFLAFGSETPDNLHCFDTIEYGRATHNNNPHQMLYGFKLKDKDIFVQDIVDILETLPIPESAQEVYPNLDREEWMASMLMSKKIIRAFSPQHNEKREFLSNIPMQQFAQRLCSLYDRFDDPDFNSQHYSIRVMKAFMDFDWTNPGNHNCFEKLEYGSLPLSYSPGIAFGFKVINKPIRIVKILNSIESEPIPETVQELYPSLTEKEWQALLRMATMIVNAFSPISNTNHMG